MGRQSRANLKKKNAQAAAGKAHVASNQELNRALANMRQLYEQAVQQKLGLEQQLHELKVMVSALLLTKSKGKGTTTVTTETIVRAANANGFEVEASEDEESVDITIVEVVEEEEVEEDGE